MWCETGRRASVPFSSDSYRNCVAVLSEVFRWRRVSEVCDYVEESWGREKGVWSTGQTLSLSKERSVGHSNGRRTWAQSKMEKRGMGKHACLPGLSEEHVT